MFGIELNYSHIDAGHAKTPALPIANDVYERGRFMQPSGPTIQLMPPLSTLDELQSFAGTLFDVLDDALRAPAT